MALPKTREDLGYKWTERTLTSALEDFGKFLERNNGKAFLMDVYASTGSVYRNLYFQFDGLLGEEGISVQFNRDEGRQLTIKSASE